MNYKTLITAAALALGSCTYAQKQQPTTIEGKLEITEMTPEEMLNVRGSTREEFEAYQRNKNYTQNNAVRNALYSNKR